MTYIYLEDSEKAIDRAKGKRISTLLLGDETLWFTFEDGSKLKIADFGQDCCEKRYMRTDDTLADFLGAEFRGIELREAPGTGGRDFDETHEVQMLIVHTDRGDITLSNHNEHNGYYGGFSVRAVAE